MASFPRPARRLRAGPMVSMAFSGRCGRCCRPRPARARPWSARARPRSAAARLRSAAAHPRSARARRRCAGARPRRFSGPRQSVDVVVESIDTLAERGDFLRARHSELREGAMYSGLEDLLEAIERIGRLAAHLSYACADTLLDSRENSLQCLLRRSARVGVNARSFSHQFLEELWGAGGRLGERT